MNINDLAIRYEEFKKSLNKHSEIQITDNKSIVLDGCRRVIEYNENCIRLELAAVAVSVVGMNLSMRNFSEGGIVIEGQIHSLTFISKEDI